MSRSTFSRFVFTFWSGAGLSVLLLMLLHRSEPAVFLARYSTSYVALLAVTLITVLIALAGSVLAWQDRLRLPDLAVGRRGLWAVSILALATIAGLWLFLPGAAFQPAIALFRVYLVALIGGGLLVGLYLAPASRAALPGRWPLALLLAAALLALGLTAAYLGRIPPSMYYDEPLLANYAWTCAHDGHPGVMMLPPRDLPFLDFVSPTILCLHGAVMQAVAPTLEVARAVGIGLVWLGAPFVFLTARRLYGDLAAVAAAAVMLLFPLAHSYLRGDHYVALALAIVLWAYVTARQQPRLWRHFLVGFVLATMIEGHQLGIRFIPVFGLLYLWDYVEVVRRRRHFVVYGPFVAFTLGGLSYAVFYYLLHAVVFVGTDFAGMLALIDTGYAEQMAIGGSLGFFERIWTVGTLGVVEYIVAHPVEVLILFAGSMTALIRRRPADQLVLFIVVGGWLTYVLLNPKHTPYYWVHTLPLVALLLASFVSALGETESWHQRPTLVAILPVLLLLVFHTAHTLRAGQLTQNADQVIAVGAAVNDLLPADIRTIAGHQVYFYGLAARDFYDLNTFVGVSVAGAVARWGIDPPQAIIMTAGLDEHSTVLDYIREQGMVAVRRYPTDFFSGESVLYLLPDAVASIPPD